MKKADIKNTACAALQTGASRRRSISPRFHCDFSLSRSPAPPPKGREENPPTVTAPAARRYLRRDRFPAFPPRAIGCISQQAPAKGARSERALSLLPLSRLLLPVNAFHDQQIILIIYHPAQKCYFPFAESPSAGIGLFGKSDKLRAAHQVNDAGNNGQHRCNPQQDIGNQRQRERGGQSAQLLYGGKHHD